MARSMWGRGARLFLLMMMGCAHTPSEPRPALPLTMDVSAGQTSADGWTPVWIRFSNHVSQDVSFTAAVVYRVVEDPGPARAYRAPSEWVNCETREPGRTFRLQSNASFSIRIDVPNESMPTERVLITAAVQVCNGRRRPSPFRLYAETPIDMPPAPSLATARSEF